MKDNALVDSVAQSGEKDVSDRAEPGARTVTPGLTGRIGQAILRPFREISARLKAAQWLIVAVAVIMVSLVLIAGLSKAFALIGFFSFVVSVMLLPRHDAEQSLEGAADRPAMTARTTSAMHVMAEALPDPVILLNAAGHVLFCNAPARGLFASLREGSHISSVIRTPEFLDAVAAAPERGRAVTVTYAERVPVGRRMAATVAPLSRRGERGGNILILLRDLTEIERINQMRADFIANASHELRTPLASLRGFIETLQSSAKSDPGARERFLPIMAEQASRMTRLIDALLSLSRVEMNAHVPPSDLVDLNDVLNHTKDTLEPLARETGFRFEVGRFPRQAIVRGDRDELLQVLQNLVQNAFKYGNKGGHVRIEAKHIPSLGRQPGRYAIAVIDDGPGIAAEHLPRLTERFYRVDVASSREKGGTGLGLAIVKHILNRHRGELAIASKPGKGSTFTVMLTEARVGQPERGAAAG
ncbi:MAG TPA: phosphate regulon sensor histidine kinase PhoR [Methyloceanibacter sp.]|nr:phosphate regulon sensor histidine kinase PhoR [Methyloceanibacter sp.]